MNQRDKLALSVVTPAYNEAGNIDATLQAIHEHINPCVPSYEIIVVDDASTDATGQLLKHWQNKKPQLTLITHQRNLGHGASVMEGYRAARGNWVLQLDCDRQFDLADFPKLWAHRNFDLVLGVRTNRQDPLLRVVISNILRQLIHLRYRVKILDANTPFRLLRKDFLMNQLRCLPSQTQIPNIHLAIAAARAGRLKETQVRHLSRSWGKGSLHLRRLVRFCYKAAQELW